MKVLVPLHGFISWNGGLDLIRVVVTALRHADPSHGLDIVCTLPNGGESASAPERALRAMVPEFTAGLPLIESEYSARDINRLAVNVGAQVVFPTMLPIRTSHVKRVGYVYDFQHRDLPELFTAEERARRDASFAETVARSDALFVTSRNVAGGVTRFLGVPEDRILVFPFTAYTDPRWLAGDVDAARAKHGVGSRYAMVSNHFWMHKDHPTAIRAFARVATQPRYADFELVLTGEPSDHRDPAYAGRLRELIASLGVESRVKIVGMIPKAEQIALLRGAAMLVQPTRYEGGPGGGASYEACGLGVPAVLSDIAVNREVVGDAVSFFRTGDDADLAEKMSAVLDAPRALPAADALAQRSRERLRHAGDTVAAFLRRLVG